MNENFIIYIPSPKFKIAKEYSHKFLQIEKSYINYQDKKNPEDIYCYHSD